MFLIIWYIVILYETLYLFYHINFHFVTDDYKWYGVVEYSAPLSQISSIRTELDWKMVDGYHIHCDFLDKSLSSYRKLNSKCLFVDNLPKDFTNTSEFRDIFSALSSPLYCQVWNRQLLISNSILEALSNCFLFFNEKNKLIVFFITKNWNWQSLECRMEEKKVIHDKLPGKFLLKSN